MALLVELVEVISDPFANGRYEVIRGLCELADIPPIGGYVTDHRGLDLKVCGVHADKAGVTLLVNRDLPRTQWWRL